MTSKLDSRITPETLRLPILADEQVCLFNEFNLKVTTNHSGTLQAGHYWAHIKDEDNRSLLKCNDTSVIATPSTGLSNTPSYVSSMQQLKFSYNFAREFDFMSYLWV